MFVNHSVLNDIFLRWGCIFVMYGVYLRDWRASCGAYLRDPGGLFT